MPEVERIGEKREEEEGKEEKIEGIAKEEEKRDMSDIAALFRLDPC